MLYASVEKIIIGRTKNCLLEFCAIEIFSVKPDDFYLFFQPHDKPGNQKFGGGGGGQSGPPTGGREFGGNMFDFTPGYVRSPRVSHLHMFN